MIPQSFIQDLLNRVDIVDVIQHYLPLKKAGSNLVACCPFHSEKTPSFTVSAAKQFYHCFGCAAHGSAINFVMQYSGMSFVEAVHELSGRFGLTIPEEFNNSPKVSATHKLMEINKVAADYYRAQLKQSSVAIDYLKRRGLSGEIAARYGIGYAPSNWQNLASAFDNYNVPELKQAGLVIESDSGKRYDRFRDRIIFPISNQRGFIIGFGGRVIEGGEPKYLNSPETPLFEKGQELYGLFQAKTAIRSVKQVLIVEGYMDVVALAQHGFENAVATLGTATTVMQIQMLLKQSQDLIFCFDGDAAGQRAARRAMENSLGLLADGHSVRFLFLPSGQDPDSFVREHGPQEFTRLISQSMPLTDFLLGEGISQVSLQSSEGRAKLIQDLKPLIKQIKAPTLGLLLRKRLAEVTGLNSAEVAGLLGMQRKFTGPTQRKVRAHRPTPSLGTKLTRVLLIKPDFGRKLEQDLLKNSVVKDVELASAVLDFIRQHPQVAAMAQIFEGFRGTPYEHALNGFAEDMLDVSEWSEAEMEQEFAGVVRQIQEYARQQRIDALRNKALLETLPANEMRELQTLLRSERVIHYEN